MANTGPTKNQANFIEKLRNSSPEREESLLHYLADHDKETVNDLSLQEASEAIDAMKKIKVEGDNSLSYLTGKQLSFLQSLTLDSARKGKAETFMKDRGKGGLNFLSLSEASELIELLKNTKPSDPSVSGGKMVSEKQVKFLNSLQDSDEKRDIGKKYLSGLKKKSLNELTSREASALIDLLRQG
jgi:hypothetical protein